MHIYTHTHTHTHIYIYIYIYTHGASPMAQQVKNSLAMQEPKETQVRSLGQEDALEEKMATNSCILVWKIPRTEEPGGLQSKGLQRVRQDLAHNTPMYTHIYIYTHTCIYMCVYTHTRAYTRVYTHTHNWLTLPYNWNWHSTVNLKPGSPALQADSLLSEQPGKHLNQLHVHKLFFF